ncbi:type II toxin-antitoxin system Phd/YefM family antitoxin [Limosilactobacillus viscerum]|uniref:type II toxin-antitoxin system Phd/YefM family antitoxin n=1 Tax=Limosilactobacillus viscerum TaxID=2993450 RepID=UPI0024BB54C4|nr:type II toxin-antitoxin system Phd/YefM family antitoxin [Limosilactobacillus viscerum]
MPLVITQSDLRKHIKDYLGQASENNQTVLVARSSHRNVAIISQEQLNALLDAVNSKEDSLDYTIARDKLIDMQMLPGDPIVEPDKNYWNKFKESEDK